MCRKWAVEEVREREGGGRVSERQKGVGMAQLRSMLGRSHGKNRRSKSSSLHCDSETTGLSVCERERVCV